MEDFKVQATIVAWFDASWAKKDLNSFKDDIQAAKERLNSDRWIVLASNLAELRIKAKELAVELKNTTSQDRKLDIQTNIELVKKQITDANRQLTNFIRTWDEAKSVLWKNFEAIDWSINKTKSVFGTLTWWFKAWLADIVKWFSIVAIVSKWFELLSQWISEWINNALQLEWLNASLDRLSAKVWETRDNILSSLREAADWTVTDVDLIKSANKALALWVWQNADDIATLLEIARLKSKAFGTTTTEAFNDIVTWLGRSSPLILDNLGITIKVWEAQEKYAASIGKTVKELTDLEKKQALINAVVTEWKQQLKEAWDVVLNTAERWEKFKVFVKDSMTVAWQWLIYFTLKLADWSEIVALSFQWSIIVLQKRISVFQLWISNVVSFLQGTVNAFRAVWYNMWAAFSQGITWVIQLWVNWVITLVEKAINILPKMINQLSSQLRKIPWFENIFWWKVSEISFWKVDLWARFDFKDVWTEFNKAFTEWSNSAIKSTIKWFDWMLAEIDNKITKKFIAQKAIKLWWAATDISWVTQWIVDDWVWWWDAKKWWKKWKSDAEKKLEKKQKEAEKAEKDALKRRVKRNKDALKESAKDAKDYIDEFEKTIKKWEKSIDDLTDKIKSANDEIKKLSEQQLWEQEKLAAKYVELQDKLRNPQEWDDLAKIQRDLELINQYTTEAQRNEAIRQSTLSDTQKIVEEIQRIEAEKKSKELEIEELEAQKEKEQVILEQFNDMKIDLERKYTLVTKEESRLRMDQLQREIDRTRELIKLQQQAWTSKVVWWAWQSNTTNNASTTNNVQIKVDWTWNPTQVAREIATQIRNFNSWQNL